ncbi:hypothetical protein EVAR_12349_1 [Eumeta japonica]|uniref:Uncharacterized protein n=1 Tax=Eumeta variegata TaxID=151549 RepID=A0A4C1X0S2_EUMVA|nr:hypothetical protein EVAR_12349_1 [Eumeta japonica]
MHKSVANCIAASTNSKRAECIARRNKTGGRRRRGMPREQRVGKCRGRRARDWNQFIHHNSLEVVSNLNHSINSTTQEPAYSKWHLYILTKGSLTATRGSLDMTEGGEKKEGSGNVVPAHHINRRQFRTAEFRALYFTEQPTELCRYEGSGSRAEIPNQNIKLVNTFEYVRSGLEARPGAGSFFRRVTVCFYFVMGGLA